MKNSTLNLCQKAILLIAVIFTSSTISADEWVTVYTNSMSAETSDGVKLEAPIYTSSGWTIKENGASQILGKTGAQNFGPCMETTNRGDYLTVEYTPTESGTYRFSFLHKVKEGDNCANAKLLYSTDNAQWTDAYQVLTAAPSKADEETGDLIKSENVELTGGTKYYFRYELGLTFMSATDLHVADFKLEILQNQQTAQKFKFSYTVEGDATVTVTGKNNTVIENNSELDRYTQYDVVATPAKDSDKIEFYINGNLVTDYTYKEDDANVYHFSGFIDMDINLLIKVVAGTSINDVKDNAEYYDAASNTIYGEGRIEVYNLTGKLVMTGYNRMNVETLNKGIYLAKTQNRVFKFRK